MRLSILVLAAGFLFATAAFADAPATVAGTWEGESKCTVPNSPCHDEHVVYEITDKSGKVSIDAYKIVNGAKDFMGTLECQYSASSGKLSCPQDGRMKAYWEFAVTGRNMKGTLTVDDSKTLYRKIDVQKK